MQTSFLNKLYEIKPFKIVNSPENFKHDQEHQTGSVEGSSAVMNTSPWTFSPGNKQNSPCASKIIDTQLFTNLSQSIDHLFFKIQKIKEEFKCSESPRLDPRSHIRPHDSRQHAKPKVSEFLDSPIDQHSTSHLQNEKMAARAIETEFAEFEIGKYARVVESLPIPNRPNQVSMKDISLGKRVGSGKFGDVHICRHNPTGTILAVKKIFKSTLREYGMVEQFVKQLKINYLLRHPNIATLYGHFEDQYHIFLLMEFAEGGTLMGHLRTDQKDVSRAIYQVLDAVAHIHRNSIAHRDIKPENIVLSNGVLKLCDFGWSAIFDTDMKKTFCGTLDYVSPEMKDKGWYTHSVDIWSIGVLTFEMLTGYPPHKHEIDKWKVASGNIKEKWCWDIIFPPEVSELAKDFVSRLLKEDPDERLTIKDCFGHEFIQKYNGQTGWSLQWEKLDLDKLILQ